MKIERNTKQEIIEASLDLFSIQGYEATSISQIADAVGVKKASLYCHFDSKKDILDSVIDACKEEYDNRSIFANADWDNAEFKAKISRMTVDDLLRLVLDQFYLVTHTREVSRIRKMLVIEQFINPELSDFMTKVSYEDVFAYNTKLISMLIENGILKDMNAETMAAQLCFPVSMWISLCDREPEREAECTGYISRHVRQFFEIYKV